MSGEVNVDFASKLEDAERQSLVAAKLREIEYIQKPAYSHCEDCGEEIAKERQKIKGVTRCIICQEIKESKNMRGLR